MKKEESYGSFLNVLILFYKETNFIQEKLSYIIEEILNGMVSNGWTWKYGALSLKLRFYFRSHESCEGVKSISARL